jgi:hypothetical protein
VFGFAHHFGVTAENLGGAGAGLAKKRSDKMIQAATATGVTQVVSPVEPVVRQPVVTGTPEALPTPVHKVAANKLLCTAGGGPVAAGATVRAQGHFVDTVQTRVDRAAPKSAFAWVAAALSSGSSVTAFDRDRRPYAVIDAYDNGYPMVVLQGPGAATSARPITELLSFSAELAPAYAGLVDPKSKMPPRVETFDGRDGASPSALFAAIADALDRHATVYVQAADGGIARVTGVAGRDPLERTVAGPLQLESLSSGAPQTLSAESLRSQQLKVIYA